MFEGLAITAKQTMILFLLMAFGAGSRWQRILDDSSVRRLTDFVLIVVTPCLIVTAFQRPFDTAVLAGFGWAFAFALFTHALAIGYSRLFTRDLDEQRLRQMRFATVFSNAGFMGFPLEYALLGPDGVLYGSIYVVVFHLLAWTYGVWELRGGSCGESVLMSLLNPGVVGLAIGFPLFLLSWSLPQVVSEPVKMIGDLNTSLSMVVLGYNLAGARFRPALGCRGTYVTLSLRHIVVPATVMVMLCFLPSVNFTVRMASVIPAAAPIGAIAVMFSVRYGKDGEFAAALVALSTLLSILTMPLIIGIASSIFVN